MGRFHVLVQLFCKDKGCSAVVLLANQSWRPVSMSEVVLNLLFSSKLLATSILSAVESPLFEMHILDMLGQSTWVIEHSITLGIVAHQLFLSMSCGALMHLQLMLDSKYLLTLASSALKSDIDKVNNFHVPGETMLCTKVL